MTLHSDDCNISPLSNCKWCFFKRVFKEDCYTYGIILCLLGGFAWSGSKPVLVVLLILGISAAIYSARRSHGRN